VISAAGLTKSYGATRAVDGLSFDVRPGVVTGFLGPNGSGKSTTMRLVMGLDRPDAGTVTIAGRRFHDLRWPLREVGALLEAKAIHPGRSAFNHLLAMAQTNSIPRGRVDEVLGLVGLETVARRKAGKFSLGMSQRLGIASALLGDPGVLLFDEPINGLDPEGILWVRNLLKGLAGEGRTIFVSSHLMSEMALTATDLVVIGRGQLIADTTVDDFIASNTVATVLVRSPETDRLAAVLRSAGAGVTTRADGALLVTGLDAARIGDAALTAGAALHELSPVQASLEEVFMELTSDMVDYHGQSPVEVGA
jgi:ABC-2 type transport system ATP-binding protein